MSGVAKVAETWPDANRHLGAAFQRTWFALHSNLSALQLHLGTKFQFLFDQVRSQVEEIGYRAELPPALEEGGDARVAIRVTRGPLDFRLPESKLKGGTWYASKDFPFNGDERFELVNFIDGKFTVTVIRNALSAEFSPVPLAAVVRYMEDLASVGVIRWKK